MSIFDGKMNLSVTSASGIEAVTKRELETLGYEAGPAVFGRIGFNGDMTALARANMFLRTANHVYVNLFSPPNPPFHEFLIFLGNGVLLLSK